MYTGITGEVFAKEACREFIFFDEPYNWVKHELTVVADRMLPDGTRQHVVKENIKPVLIDNAQVFSQKYYLDYCNNL